MPKQNRNRMVLGVPYEGVGLGAFVAAMVGLAFGGLSPIGGLIAAGTYILVHSILATITAGDPGRFYAIFEAIKQRSRRDR